MTVLPNKIKNIGLIQCHDHKRDVSHIDRLCANQSPLYTMTIWNHHEVYDVKGVLLYKCPKREGFKKVPKGAQLSMHYSGSEYKWIEDNLVPYGPKSP